MFTSSFKEYNRLALAIELAIARAWWNRMALRGLLSWELSPGPQIGPERDGLRGPLERAQPPPVARGDWTARQENGPP